MNARDNTRGVMMAAGNPVAGSPIESTAAARAAVSDDEKVEAPEAAPRRSESDRFVLYLGPRNAVANAEELQKRSPRLGEGTKAEITPQDWAKAGIGGGSKTLVWSVFNNYLVPASQFSDQQLDYLLSNSKRFQLVDRDGNKVKH